MPQPWATCTECMLLPHDEQPVPEKPPAPPAPAPKPKAARKRSGASTTAVRSPRQPSARLPRHADDDRPELIGSCDLSYEVPDEHVPHHVRGADHDWLPISTFPSELRPNGWVYLQVDQDLVARARVTGVGFRDRRWTHQPTETASDMGAGPTLELRTDSWERNRWPLGPDGDRPIKGYRYLVTGPDDSVRVADETVSS